MMTMSEYPKIRDSYRKPRKPDHPQYIQGSPCVICGQLTVGGWWIQTGWMRGDDVLARACDKHYKDKSALIKAWLGSEQEATHDPE